MAMLTKPCVVLIPKAGWSNGRKILVAGESFQFKALAKKFQAKYKSFTTTPISYDIEINGLKFSIGDALFAEKTASRDATSSINTSKSIVFVFGSDAEEIKEIVQRVKDYIPYKEHEAFFLVLQHGKVAKIEYDKDDDDTFAHAIGEPESAKSSQSSDGSIDGGSSEEQESPEESILISLFNTFAPESCKLENCLIM